MKRALTSALAAMLILSGCASSEDSEGRNRESANNNTFEIQQNMSNGDTIRCIVFSQNYRGGISCDWENPL